MSKPGFGSVIQCHGADVGYFQTKHAHSDGSTLIYPSLAGPTPAGLGLADLGRSDLLYRMREPYDMVIGRLAYAQKVGAPDIDARWFTSHAYYGLVMAGLCDNSSFSLSYRLVTGLPIDHMQHRESLMAGLNGKHQVVWDHIGQAQTIHIEPLVVAQGIGALATILLDEDGTPLLPVEQLRNDEHAVRALVCDCGAGTTCILGSRAFHVVASETRSITVGAWTVEDLFRRAIVSEYGEGLVRKLGRHELLHLARENRLSDRGKPLDTSAIFDAVCAQVAGMIVAELHSMVGEAREYEHVVLAGGGGLLLAKHLQRAYPHMQLAADPVFANSEGYRRISALMLLK